MLRLLPPRVHQVIYHGLLYVLVGVNMWYRCIRSRWNNDVWRRWRISYRRVRGVVRPTTKRVGHIFFDVFLVWKVLVVHNVAKWWCFALCQCFHRWRWCCSMRWTGESEAGRKPERSEVPYGTTDVGGVYRRLTNQGVSKVGKGESVYRVEFWFLGWFALFLVKCKNFTFLNERL